MRLSMFEDFEFAKVWNFCLIIAIDPWSDYLVNSFFIRETIFRANILVLLYLVCLAIEKVSGHMSP